MVDVWMLSPQVSRAILSDADRRVLRRVGGIEQGNDFSALGRSRIGGRASRALTGGALLLMCWAFKMLNSQVHRTLQWIVHRP